MYPPELTFLHFNRMPQCAARVAKHFEGYYTLQFAETGGVELWYDEDCHQLEAGRAWYWPAYPGPRIRFHVACGQETWIHRYCAFRGAVVARWIAQGIWPPTPQTAPQTQAVAEHALRFDRLLSLLRTGDHWSAARAVNLLEAILLELAEERAREAIQEPQPWLKATLEQLEGEAEPDYSSLAAAQGFSLAHLRRLFRAATGTALHSYRVQHRINRARMLLGESNLPIKVIAEQLGYQDVYFFTRQFRKVAGVPPAAYRRSRQ